MSRQNLSTNLTSLQRNLSLTFPFSGAIAVHWFIVLRWVAVLGQLFTILMVWNIFQVQLPLKPLLITVGITAASNLLLMFWYLGYRRTVNDSAHSRLWYNVLALVMALDLILLTTLLYYSGGPTNPFWIFYLVNLCLAGVELTATVAWCLNFLAVFCFMFLLYDHYPLYVLGFERFLPSISEAGIITLAHNGVFCAFITCAFGHCHLYDVGDQEIKTARTGITTAGSSPDSRRKTGSAGHTGSRGCPRTGHATGNDCADRR